ncbi:MAG: glycosyl hydrolase [Limisphaerales bacterium]
MTQPNCFRFVRFATALFFAGLLHAAFAVDSAAVRGLFANPPREHSTGPLWVWNDMLTEQEIVDTMHDLAGQQVKQVFVHPRPGLMTPYLSPDWFRLWKIALREAKRLDMNVWIYDENSYPSGFAGGWVPELMPESRGRGLSLREAKTPPKWKDDLIAVYRLDGDRIDNVTVQVRAGDTLTEARYVVASVVRAANSPWNGDRCYVDLMYPGVTEKFLEITLDAYRREIGSEFGKRVPGVFTDEPNIHPAGGLPWTDDLPQQFQKRWGYNLLDHLPSLTRPVGDWRKVRHDYFHVLNALFIERWAMPYHDYCAKHGLEWTGHYWDHEWPECSGVPDNMAMYAWSQRPAIDCLMNQYQEHTHAQFGNLRMPKELSSVANQLGLKRTLCEVYGAGGWDLRFEDMKRIGDWLEVFGVNTLDQHLSYVTIRGARKRDHPQSFSYHEPWWKAYHVSAEYFARLSAALSQGEQINRVLVLEPTTTAWMYQGDAPKLKEIGDRFFKFLMTLEAAQIEYDLGDEDVIARHGSIQGGDLQIGQRRYHTILLPAANENLERPTASLLAGFRGQLFNQTVATNDLDEGFRAVWSGPPFLSGRLDGKPIGQSDAQAYGSIVIEPLPAILRDLAAPREPDGFAIHRGPDDPGILFHHRRQLEDGQLLFLVNTSLDSPSAGRIESGLQGIQQWNLNTGKIEPYRFEDAGSSVQAKFELPPCGSLLLFLSRKPLKPAPAPPETITALPATGGVGIHRIAPNVLTLDYVDITAGGETRSNLYVYQANQFAWQKNGWARDPWDSAVQFKDEIIRKKFPPDSGFTAIYRFVIAEKVPATLSLVIERPDLYTITCNGRSVAAKPGTWWLDKSFGRIDIASAARAGGNEVAIKASPFTIYHELESAYLLGDFTLNAADHGFVIVPERPLELGKWNEQGRPFYSAGVGYRQKFAVENLAGQYVVSLPAWYGSVAKVNVNGKTAGYIGWPPWQCDVTKQMRRGENSIEIVVIGTLKNTLGPHHGNPVLGTAWPGMFQHGPNPGPPPGASYSTVGYGLFEPFVLKHVEASATAAAPAHGRAVALGQRRVGAP